MYSAELTVPFSPTTLKFPSINSIDKAGLHHLVCDEEVRLAFYEMGANKGPGPDGLPLFFFQKNRKVVGPAVCGCI